MKQNVKNVEKHENENYSEKKNPAFMASCFFRAYQSMLLMYQSIDQAKYCTFMPLC